MAGSGFSRSFFGRGSLGSSVSKLLKEMVALDWLGRFRVRRGRPPSYFSEATDFPLWEEDCSSSLSMSSSSSSPFLEEAREFPDLISEDSRIVIPWVVLFLCAPFGGGGS